jgi:hypothetical protein
VDRDFITACRHGHTKTVKMFIEKGVNVNIYNDKSIQVSSKNGHLEVVKLLIENGADVHVYCDQCIVESSCNVYTRIVKLLIENGANVHAQDNHCIKKASHKGHLETVKLLIENRANIHAEDEYCIRIASAFGHLKIVKLLYWKYPLSQRKSIREMLPKIVKVWNKRKLLKNPITKCTFSEFYPDITLLWYSFYLHFAFATSILVSTLTDFGKINKKYFVNLFHFVKLFFKVIM